MRIYIPISIQKNKSIEVIETRFKNNAKEDDRYILITADGRYVGSYYIQLPLINFVGFECENWPFSVAVDEDKDYRDLFRLDLQWGYNYILSRSEWHMEITEFHDFELNIRV